MAPLISLGGVGRTFADGRTVALEDIDLDVAAGEFVSVVGPSGCGKTTLLRLVAGLIAPTAGRIEVDGAPPRPGADRAMVFQTARLLPWRTVAGNIEFVLALRGLGHAEARERAQALLAAVGLGGFAGAWPHQLSGGMQQRVGLVRALAVEPRVLLMDEPFAALDAMTRETLRGEVLRLLDRRPMAVILVTHDIDEAILMSRRIVVLRPRPGRIDAVLTVDLPGPRWQGDLHGHPAFAALRSELRDRLGAMTAEGDQLGDLGRAFGGPES